MTEIRCCPSTPCSVCLDDALDAGDPWNECLGSFVPYDVLAHITRVLGGRGLALALVKSFTDPELKAMSAQIGDHFSDTDETWERLEIAMDESRHLKSDRS